MSNRPSYPFEIAMPVTFECPDLAARAHSHAELPWIPVELPEPSPPRRRSGGLRRRLRRLFRS